ncbi:MAG: hypothetical protein HQL76_09825 [Magnetococcales bacterium]|nr:hypothetical protein [Magnetococcales bacterium]
MKGIVSGMVLNGDGAAVRRKVSGRGMVVPLILTLAFSVVFPVAAEMATSDRILPLLQGFEWNDRPDRFVAVGEGADRVLMEIASDPRWHGVLRFRALAVLRFFPNAAVASFLETLIGQNPSPELLRRGLAAYTQAFGKSDPDRVAQLAAPLLRHDNGQIRSQAAATLKELPWDALSPSTRLALETEQFQSAELPVLR